MGLCDETNRKSTISLLLFAGTGIPITVYMAADGGIAALEPALLSGVVVGGIVAGLYYLYECDFNLGKCTGSVVASTGCDIWSSITGLFSS
jgi:hypothetical protein